MFISSETKTITIINKYSDRIIPLSSFYLEENRSLARPPRVQCYKPLEPSNIQCIYKLIKCTFTPYCTMLSISVCYLYFGMWYNSHSIGRRGGLFTSFWVAQGWWRAGVGVRRSGVPGSHWGELWPCSCTHDSTRRTTTKRIMHIFVHQHHYLYMYR